MFNKYFDVVCIKINERMVVMITDAILLLQTDLNIRTIAHSRPIWAINVFN